MSIIQDGTRSDEARARVEDRNNLDAINKIYVGTGESITVNGHTVWQTEGKNIIKAINDAGTVANATNAASATNADYATNAGSATTADQATNLTSTGKIGNYNTNEIINFDNGFVRNANYATNAGSATTADQATNLTSTGKIGNYNTNEIINFDNGFVRNANYATNADNYTENGTIKTQLDKLDERIPRYYGIKLTSGWGGETNKTIPVNDDFITYTSGISEIKGINLFVTDDGQTQILKIPMSEYLILGSGEQQSTTVTYSVTLMNKSGGVDYYEGRWTSVNSGYLELSHTILTIK